MKSYVHAKKLPKNYDRKIVITAIGVIVLFFISIIIFTGVSLAGTVTVFDDNINNKEEDRPPVDPNAGDAINILLLGIDDRSGENAQLYGDELDEYEHQSDTTIVMHISSDRSRVEAISIPRDSIVDIPSCDLKKDKTMKKRDDSMFNSAFSGAWAQSQDNTVAASCTRKTVESITGLHIDYTAIADFNAFMKMIDALGGVNMCVPEDIDSPEAGFLKLKKGMNHMDGATATQFARARKGEGLGDGSDLMRIGRQQKLVGALMQEALAKDFSDIVPLLRFVKSAASAITTTMSVDTIAGIAWSIRNIRTDNIFFAMIPVEEYKYDPNRVQWTEDAQDIWNNLIKDKPIFPEVAIEAPVQKFDENGNPIEPDPAASNDPNRIAVGTDDETGIDFRTAFNADSCDPTEEDLAEGDEPTATTTPKKKKSSTKKDSTTDKIEDKTTE